ncbi:MAG: hypothetical protein H6867_04430 [Rhodospirillales bacterium]|nr:hypothetical protein [Rhodospirillales bacterium]MCB9996397.1 hypothetical protein [Rhodospirillales bacterium]
MALTRMEDLKSDMCRWPHGDPRNKEKFHFCGAKRSSGSAYCCEHEHVARRGSGDSDAKKAA